MVARGGVRAVEPTVRRGAPGGPRGGARRDGRGRNLAAGEILGIGLLCFAIWLFLDARQLFSAADASPLGTRRSVAMAILRPIARASELFSLDRLVSSTDRVLGRSVGTPGNGVGTGTLPVAPPTTASPTTTPVSRAGHPGGGGSGSAPKNTTPSSVPASATTLPQRAPGLAQPTAAHPLTLLDVGDSIGMDLGSGLADAIGANPAVKVVQDSVGDTGLANVAYFDWLGTLPKELAQYRPRVVVVMLGGNDWQPFFAGPTKAIPGTPFWRAQYSARVAAMMAEATRTGARVEWVGLPIMAPSSGLASAAVQLNAIYAAQAKLHPGVTYFSSYKLFANSAGQYSEYLPNAAGDLVAVRDPDGIHIAPPGGEDLIGNAVVHAMAAQWHVRL